MTRRVLLIDNHVATRIGLERILTECLEGAMYGHAGDAARALEMVRKEPWDLIILDVNLSGRGGLELIRDLKAQRPAQRILVYSVLPEERMGIRALRAGADGYVTKDSPEETICRAAVGVLKGERFISPNLAALLLHSMTGGGASSADLLSDREYQVLRAIASGKTPSEVAKALTLSVKTVSTYRSRMLEKLRLRTTADLIRFAIDQGIVE